MTLQFPNPNLSSQRASSSAVSNRLDDAEEARTSARLLGNLEALPPPMALPQRRRSGISGELISFLLCVVLPVLAATVYYVGYASKQYSASFNFVIRDTRTAANPGGVVSPLLSMLGGSNMASQAENYMVTEYILSRQAVDDLQAKISVRDMYSKADIDWWSRFDGSKPMERFLKYWQYMTTASFDEVTGTAAVEVRAFTPEDAYVIAKTLLSLSEKLVNETEQAPLMEGLRFAESELKRAEERLDQKRAVLTAYRNKETLIEPNSSVVLSNATLAGTLRATIAQIQTDTAALEKQKLSANSPQLQFLKVRLKSTQEQLVAVEAEVAKGKGGNSSIAQAVGRYEELDLERQFAQTMVLSAMQAVDQARANAIAQHIYITPYVRPAMPQTSLYPNRPIAILTVAGACFLFWTIGLLVVRSIREHLA